MMSDNVEKSQKVVLILANSKQHCNVLAYPFLVTPKCMRTVAIQFRQLKPGLLKGEVSLFG